MFEQSTVSLKITFRPCHQEDLPKLEWFGMFSDQREIFFKTFERHQITTAENSLKERGFAVAEIGVEKDNLKSLLQTVHHAISLLLHPPILNFGKMKLGAIS
jgi:hypothetical protein